MDPVSSEPFFGSKTMCLLCIGMALIFALILLAVLVKVVWKVDVFQIVGAGIFGISSHSGAGTVRNVMTDTPQRQMYTQAGVTAPMGTLEATVPMGTDASAAGHSASPYGSGPPGGQQ